MDQTIEDLGRLVKAKHPEYAHLPDADIGKRVKGKYAGSYDQFRDLPESLNAGLPGPAKPDANKILQPVFRQTGEQIPQEQQSNVLSPPLDSRPGLPIVGGMMAGIPGAAAGSAIKNALSDNPSLTDVAKDTVIQGVIPKVIGSAVSKGVQAIAKSSPAIQKLVRGENAAKFDETLKPMMHDESQVVQEMGQNATPSALKLKSNKLAGERSLNDDLYDAARGKIPVTKLGDRIFSNIDDLRQLKMADPSGVEKLGLSRLLKKGADPSKVLDTLKGTDSNYYKEALNPETHQSLTNLMTAAQKSASDGNGIEKVLSYGKGKFLLSLPLIAAAPVVGLGLAGKTLGAVVLTESAISKLVQNPQIAKLAVEATKVPMGSPQYQLISRALMASLSGTEVIKKDEDGNDEKLMVGPKGELQYPK